MGKQGPCYHCGVTSTPLWRNGPPEKPVLCNACGSRWRTKGTLANYTPLHSRADPSDYEDHRMAKMKNTPVNKGKEMKLLKRKHYSDNMVMANGGVGVDYIQGFQKIVDDDSSNRSSSGSAISNSDAQFCPADASDLTGPAQSVVWDTMVPSKRRTCVNRPKQSSVEKLTRDLHSILQEQQSSCFSGSSEEDLLFESETPMVSIEIGHGTVLIRHPNAIAREEESEASSLSFDQRQNKINDAYSPVTPLSSNSKSVNFPFPSPRIQKVKSYSSQDIGQERRKRDMTQQEKIENGLDAKDGLGLKDLAKQLTDEEKQQLLNYKPAADTAEVPESLRSLLEKPEVKENLPSLQRLLTEGGFEECKDWPERSSITASNATGSGFLINGKKVHDVMNPKFSELKQMKSPKRLTSKSSCEKKELLDSDGSCISPRSIFAVPHDGGASFMLDSSPFVDESSDQDLLLNVPCSSSFPQAELLQSAPSLFSHQVSTSSSSVYQHPGHP